MFGLPEVPVVGPSDVPADAFLLDVREPDEWQAGHVAGSVHVPLQDVPARLAELPADRTVVVVCRSGGRSHHAAAWLAAQGFGVANLGGGLQAWQAAGRPLVSEGPEDPHVL